MDFVAALEKSASAVPSQRASGDAELKALEERSGFYQTLLAIYADSQASNSSRYLALTYLKNAVDQKWRRAAVFPHETKEFLRIQLLALVDTPPTTSSSPMAKQLAVIIAAIARSDVPRLWPDLLEQLQAKVVAAAQTPNQPGNLVASLEVLHQTLKKLGTTRIGAARTLLNEFAVEHVKLYWQLFSSLQNYTALKIVGCLLYDGHERAHRFEAPQRVFHELTQLLQNQLQQQQQNDIKFVVRLGKIFERLVTKHPFVFAGFGEDAGSVCSIYLQFLAHPSPEKNHKVVVQAMCVTRELTRFVKQGSRHEASLPLNQRPRDDTDRQELSAGFALFEQVFNQEVLTKLVTAIITSYFKLTEEDVGLWHDCPEEFVVEEAVQSPEFSVALCAELLFAHTLKAWPEHIAPLAQQLIEQAVHDHGELGVEAALRALEFGAPTFSQSFDIEPVVRVLITTGGCSTSSPVIRRRLCLVLGGWVPVKGSEQLQTMAFELVKDTLSTNRWDIVVKLGALELARICCDDIDFIPQLFSIASESVMQTSYELLQATDLGTEIKLQVLRVLSTVVEGMGPQLAPEDMARVLEILPTLWTTETERSNHHLVQGAVLQALAHVVNSTGTTTTTGSTTGSLSRLQCYQIGVPLVDVATDPKQPLAQFLMDDALTLWKALLVHATTSVVVGGLFERLVVLVETKTEYLGPLLGILESYLWLDPQLAVPHYSRLFSNFALYLNDGCALDEALFILLCTETAVSLNNGERETAALQQSGMMQWMEQCVHKSSEEDAMMDALIQASKCLNILSLVSVKTGGRGIVGYEQLYPAWLDKLHGLSDPRDRKLSCMGVTSLLVAHPELYEQFGKAYIDTISSIVDKIPDSAGFSRFYQHHLDDRLSAEEERQQHARSNELAVVVGLKPFIHDAAQHMQDPAFLQAAITAGIIP